jgi:Cu+-exporting ATPase
LQGDKLEAPKPTGISLPVLGSTPKHKDPVCGMTVDPGKAAGRAEHGGETFYFCSGRCAERFSKEPGKFLAATGTAGMEHHVLSPEQSAQEHAGVAAPVDASPKSIRYTCPMHPEIVRNGPGS